jgi:hypothetical protein
MASRADLPKTVTVAEHQANRLRRLRVAAWRAFTALTATAAITWSSGCSRSTFIQNPYQAIPRSTPEQIAQAQQPEALHADLDAIVALHERTNPNPYLRVSRETVHKLADTLKASINRPMTRQEFLPFVMQLQAGYRSDHLGQGVPHEDLEAALARGERLLPFRAEPKDDGLVVVAVAQSERAIEPGDTIVRIGIESAADHLARLRALVPNETARYQDTQIRERFRTLAWAAGIALPTQVEVIRPDGSRRTVTVEGVGNDARKTERTAATGGSANAPADPRREVLVDSPPFRALLLLGEPPAAAPIALIEFPSMSGPLGSQWNSFLDDALTAIKARGAAGLIVDIRRNAGGDSALGDVLLARINDRPYRMASRIVWRRSADSDELLRVGTKPMWRWLMFALPLFIPEYSAPKYGEDLVYEIKAASRPRVEPRFDGPTSLLIGEHTHSSAMLLADAARTYDLMLTVGQPTGGVPNALGDIGPFKLPNSRIVVSFSQKMFIRANGDESDLGPVRPHIEVAPVAGRDATLDRVIADLRRTAAERKQ